MQSSVATNLHYFSILFYNKSQKVEDSGNSRFVLIHALRLHCWVHTKECRFFTLLDWFDCIFAVTDGICSLTVNQKRPLEKIIFTLRDKFSSVYPFHIVFAPNSALFSNNFWGIFFKIIPSQNETFYPMAILFSLFILWQIFFFTFHPMAFFFHFLNWEFKAQTIWNG